MRGESQKEIDSQGSTVSPRSSTPLATPSVAPSSDPRAQPAPAERAKFPKLLLALVIVLASTTALALHIQSFVDDPKFRGVMISVEMQDRFKSMLPRDRSLAHLIMTFSKIQLSVWLVGAVVLSLVSWTSWRSMLWKWGIRFGWLGIFGLFELLWAVCPTSPADNESNLMTLVLACLPFVHTISWAGMIAGALGLMVSNGPLSGLGRVLAHPVIVWLAMIVYICTFTALSVFQYRALNVPHGDSAMYEEHLWNLLHGKGFRSQLDGGRLFFGEHFEVIHVLLLPAYVLFPSLPTLNACLTIGLASGAVAVRGITRRLSGSAAAANWLAVAYLLYFPLQYLNLEVSLKTFRPENLGVPLLLFAIWSLEANRWRTMVVLLGLTLLCKEDYAIPVGMLGLFLAFRGNSETSSRKSRLLGLGVCAFAVVFLWFVLDIFIPHFRGGGPPHYMAYYPELGTTPQEIVLNVLRHPGVLWSRLAQGSTLTFVLLLTVPLAGLPLLGIGRLWVLLPTMASILLIELDGARSPYFHFHAPLVPVIFWAAAEGLGRFPMAECGMRDDSAGHSTGSPISRSAMHAPNSVTVARFAAICALVAGLWSGKSPLSLSFYDSSMLSSFGEFLYFPIGISLDRVQAFNRLLPLIPPDASVAATDFLRPRFTHHRECHQYGEGGLKPHVNPDSIDFIVVDLLGPFSDWHRELKLRELIEEPERWELVHWDPIGDLFFQVLRAKREVGDRAHAEASEPPGPESGHASGSETESARETGSL